MKKLTSSLVGIALTLGLAIPALAATSTAPVAPRAFDVTFDGYYLVTNNSVASQQSLKGIGVINADAAGALSGIEDLTLVNPSLSSTPGSTLSCGGSLGAGSAITANNDGTFGMSIEFLPDSAAATNGCFQSTTTYVCTRHVVREKLESDLSAGQYHCIATGATTTTTNVTIDAVSETAHFGSHVVDTISGD